MVIRKGMITFSCIFLCCTVEYCVNNTDVGAIFFFPGLFLIIFSYFGSFMVVWGLGLWGWGHILGIWVGGFSLWGLGPVVWGLLDFGLGQIGRAHV